MKLWLNVAEGADALILLTQWSEFRRLDLDRLVHATADGRWQRRLPAGRN